MTKIYGYRLSPYVERVYQMVQSKKLTGLFEFCPVPEGGLKCAEYLSLNPFGKMPVLVEGDFCLPEAAIICEYIENKYPEHPMIPKDATERLEVNYIQRMLDVYCFPGMFGATSDMRGPNPDRAAIAQKFVDVNHALDQIEKFATATGSGYIVGDKWTLADCAMVPADFFFERIMKQAGFDVYENRPKLHSWHVANKDSERMKEAYKTMDKELIAFMKRLKEQS